MANQIKEPENSTDRILSEIMGDMMEKKLSIHKDREPRLVVSPNMIVQTATFQPDSRMPKAVQETILQKHHEREEIMRMWREEGSVKGFIPQTPEARKMKMKARLLAKQEGKDKASLKSFWTRFQKSMDMSHGVTAEEVLVESDTE